MKEEGNQAAVVHHLRSWSLGLFVLSLLLVLSFTVGLRAIMTTPERRILFVGDSFTYYNGGMDAAVTAVAGGDSRTLLCHSQTKGGATLATLWGLPEVLSAIDAKQHDIVVLQDDLPEYINAARMDESFPKYTRLFVDRVRASGATPLLFMAWSYDRLSWVSQTSIALAHKNIAKELNVSVAPVGLAFARSTEQRPDLKMLGKDGEHESIWGTYLAANVIYSTIFNVDVAAIKSPYVPWGISADEAAHLRRVASEVVVQWKKDE